MGLSISKKCFLTAAEELNFTKAAKKLFLSQQTLSQHILNLEEEYGTILFNRKPYVSLTPAGEVLYENFLKIKIIEDEIKNHLADVKNDKVRLNIGVHSSRAYAFFPEFLEKNPDILEEIDIDIEDGVTKDFEKYLAQGKIDAFISVNPTVNSEYEEEVLFEEGMFVIASDELLRNCLGKKYESFMKDSHLGLNVSAFTQLPFIMHSKTSAFVQSLESFINSQGLNINSVIRTNGVEIHYALCEKSLGACFVPAMFLKMFLTRNINNRNMHAFVVKEFGHPNRYSIVYRKNKFMSLAEQSFIKKLKVYFKKLDDEVKFYEQSGVVETDT